MSNRKKIISDIIIITLTVFVFLQIFFPAVALKVIGFRNFVVISDSMEPKIMVNDMVVVRNINPSKLKEGDIITFYAYLPTIQLDQLGNPIYKKFVITHYLGEIIEENDQIIYKTYGIKNNPDFEYDQWKDQDGELTDITDEDIIGKVVLTIPKVGFISTIFFNIFRNPIFLIFIFINIGIFYIIFRMIKQLKKEKNRGLE